MFEAPVQNTLQTQQSTIQVSFLKHKSLYSIT